MKKISQYFLFLALAFNFSCGEASSGKKETPTSTVAEIKFESEKLELGVSDGKTNVTTDFKFWNAGGAPLTIIEAKGNCHCVQGKFIEKSIEPGDSSVINLSFDPTGVTGLYVRTMMIRSNAARPEVELTITGEIKRDPKK